VRRRRARAGRQGGEPERHRWTWWHSAAGGVDHGRNQEPARSDRGRSPGYRWPAVSQGCLASRQLFAGWVLAGRRDGGKVVGVKSLPTSVCRHAFCADSPPGGGSNQAGAGLFFDYSSAWPRSVIGKLRPNALAVSVLIISCTRVACPI